MNASQKIATGMASIIALGMLTFTSVSADPAQRPASREAAPQSAVAYNGTETPQDLTWDMTYGELAPSVVVAEALSLETSEGDVSDLSMG